ncbi:unnamed protein product [Microthlaspi erraticum]|uniref:C2H2-type domain-containing protein n=1 Tax=Microthlaspi erraticum TaxID=1685480 RepID=A0A6D2IQT5_9BRAS|nr:unnamed protein product [Microthlaspi erraticum]
MVDPGVHAYAAMALLELAKHLDSALYYRKAKKAAESNLSFLASFDRLSLDEEDTKRTLESVLQVAESKILLGVTGKISEPNVREAENVRVVDAVAGKRLKSYWAGMGAESKKKFLRVSIAELTSYVEGLFGREGEEEWEQVLDSARRNKKWRFWMCRTCSLKFFHHKKFKNHLEQAHAAKFKPSTTKHMAQRVDEVWAGMLSSAAAEWEPVDTVAAGEMIKTRLELVKAFVYENGWSRDWPLAADGERRKLLKQIQLLLVLLRERKILSCGVRDWMMLFVIM